MRGDNPAAIHVVHHHAGGAAASARWLAQVGVDIAAVRQLRPLAADVAQPQPDTAPHLALCKVERVLRFRFHPFRDAAIVLSAVLLFSWLAWMTSRAAPPEFDMAARAAVHAYANPWLTSVMIFASQVGGGWVLWPAGALIVGLMASAGRGREAALFGVAVVSANLVNEGMKLVFHRPRPEAWFGYPLPGTFSFPSGHAFVSFCFFLGLAEILVRDEWSPARKVALWAAAVACTLTIGLSRVYLGVHYPTDVLGGYAAASLWTTLIRVAHHGLQARSRRRVGRGVAKSD